ncbi:tRNA dihydrouridine synthase DusB [Candidatus Woesearchaeota archaeon]|nr:MAG: tRNA dihydrouridine synthase DusB [Candidatus Woesearchaeota archaeon]
MARFPKLESPAILSPMAGVTDVAFRTLCKELGAGLTVTEFINSTGLVRGNKTAEKMLKTDPVEKPVAVQLFGNSDEDIIEAARLVEDKFDIIDLNCGCPAWKVVRSGAGSAMLNNPERIRKLLSKLTSATNTPITIKIRKGIDEAHVNAVEVALAAQDAGCCAIAVHGRTQKQGYKGKADWNIIKDVKEKVSIPVIGNGDVFSPETFKKRLDESGVDAILIARGAIGNPGIFKQIKEYLSKGEYEKESCAKHFSRYYSLAKKHSIPFSQIKMQAINFARDFDGAARAREELARAQCEEKILEIFDRIAQTE